MKKNINYCIYAFLIIVFLVMFLFIDASLETWMITVVEVGTAVLGFISILYSVDIKIIHQYICFKTFNYKNLYIFYFLLES